MAPRLGCGQRPLVTRSAADDVLANSITSSRPQGCCKRCRGRPLPRRHRRHALGIAKAVEQSRMNTDAFVSVAQRAAALAEYVQEKTLGSNGGTISTDMQVILQELHSALGKVQDTVQRELDRGSFNRFFRRAKLRGKAQECLQKLDDAWRSFDVERDLVRLERHGESLQRQVESLKGQVELQATFEPGCLVSASALPTTALFSQLLSDIQRTEAHTKIPYRTRTHHGYQYSAILGTRPVTVRTYGHKLKDNVFESIQMYSENNHESHETFSNVIAMATLMLESNSMSLTVVCAFSFIIQLLNERSLRADTSQWPMQRAEFTIVPSQNDPGHWCIGQQILSASSYTYDKFFTDHALRLSRLHGIDLSDLFLLDAAIMGVGVHWRRSHARYTQCVRRVTFNVIHDLLQVTVDTATAWLHKQPLDEHGVPHKLWAYWSFDEEPVPVGHPPPDVPWMLRTAKLWPGSRKAIDTDKIAPRTGHSCTGESSDDDDDDAGYTQRE
ncbi:uncharacterized protein BXZ73DRAFT_81107 [Epithele typhae]|uniref:uncharacterized protein n=1 Tax=Epithele typhae TaxID=378194 RepID=UPI0020080BDA|nr:uncharacterized protein BXZ73DRAFT_81107 [Epithele typhae]KAH9916425.1 hypothetical protein BXZ73DRAFT_81107 [Epithele typhae]